MFVNGKNLIRLKRRIKKSMVSNKERWNTTKERMNRIGSQHQNIINYIFIINLAHFEFE